MRSSVVPVWVFATVFCRGDRIFSEGAGPLEEQSSASVTTDVAVSLATPRTL
jgi:hypothetical protein